MEFTAWVWIAVSGVIIINSNGFPRHNTKHRMTDRTLAQRADSKDILRPNAGVVFEHIGKVRSGSGYWYHSFIITLPLPRVQMPRQVDSIHGLIGEEINYYKEMQKSISERARQVRQFAVDMLPALPEYNKNETTGSIKRTAPIAFIGPMKKSRFRTATAEDLEKVGNLANRLAKGQNRLNKALTASVENLESYMKTSNERFANLHEVITLNHQAMMTQQDRMQKSTNNVKLELERERNMTLLLMIQQQRYTSMNALLDEWKNAIFHLVRGSIPNALVSEGMMADALRDLKQVNKKIGEKYELMFNDPIHFFHDAEFLTFVEDLPEAINVWITLKLEVSTFEAMDLYRIHTWDVPIYEGSNHSTRIGDLPPFAALSKDRLMYFTLSNADFVRCRGHDILVCPYRKAATAADSDHCIAGLLRDTVDQCRPVVVFNTIKPLVNPVTDVLVLMQRIDSYYFECKGFGHRTFGCDSCLVYVPCHCTIRTKHVVYVAPIGPSCGDERIRQSWTHSFNLAVYNAFLREVYPNISITASTLMSKKHAISKKKLQEIDDYYKTLDNKGTMTQTRLIDIGTREETEEEGMTEAPWIQAPSAIISITTALSIIIILIVAGGVWVKVRKCKSRVMYVCDT